MGIVRISDILARKDPVKYEKMERDKKVEEELQEELGRAKIALKSMSEFNDELGNTNTDLKKEISSLKGKLTRSENKGDDKDVEIKMLKEQIEELNSDPEESTEEEL